MKINMYPLQLDSGSRVILKLMKIISQVVKSNRTAPLRVKTDQLQKEFTSCMRVTFFMSAYLSMVPGIKRENINLILGEKCPIFFLLDELEYFLSRYVIQSEV